MKFNLKGTAVLLGAAATVLALDNLRLRATCSALEKAVRYAVGGIHLDGVGGIYDVEDKLGEEIDGRADREEN